ncbi:MAG: SgrR family transcriptional regulator, partial [Vibrio sp.]
MASPRLRRQFEKLYEHFQGQDSDAQLEDITDILCCTRRNARMVLNKLTQEDWITWYPSAGRGKSSRLEFKRSKQAVGENLARDYLEAGRIEQALAVLGDDFSKLSAVFQDYLGFSHGQHVIRLPYYRQLATLDPRRPTRRSEQHIIRQVFSGLTRLDDAGEVCPDLSHHWEMLSATHWRFYLRPNVRFHRGDILLMDDVIQSLEGLKQTTLFAHIDKLVSPSEQVIDIHLSQADFHLPLLLTETQAKIMRVCDTKHENFSLLPNGTGPYQVVRNDEKRLVLNAHDNYFGFRPLIDKVEVWVIDENHSYMISPSLAQPIANATNSPSDVEL